MKNAPARATERADQPPSTGGTSAGRARMLGLILGVLAIGSVAAAAQFRRCLLTTLLFSYLRIAVLALSSSACAMFIKRLLRIAH